MAEADFAARTPTGVQDSDELYLLAPSGDNVKVRDELMDIKHLQEVDAHGLERWSPMLKAPFPLSPADAAAVSEALGIGGAPTASEPVSLDALLAAHGGPVGPIRAVPVHKHRVRYRVGGCLAEVADIEVEGRSARTVAVESEDPAAVLTTVRSMGLGGYRNTSYPLGLAAIVDGTTTRAAIIDVGTNSVKLCVGEPSTDGRWRFLADRSEVTRLGEGIATGGTIPDVAVERTIAAIEGMLSEARDLGAVAVEALGTAGLRAATNAASVIARIAARTGVRIEVISGEEESRLAYVGVASDLDLGDGSLVVFDTGGGSTQLTFGRGRHVDERFSLPIGAVRFTERFGLDQAVSLDRLREARTTIAAELGVLRDRPRPEALVGIGGAVTNLVAVQLAMDPYDPDRVRGAGLGADEVERQIERYREQDAAARAGTVGLQAGRAPVILAGACIVAAVMELLGQASLVVSDRGLRHGALIERFGIDRSAGARGSGRTPDDLH
jgi:exopolyphosphatase/guanosine-5'-triphosphate,3'-diphosphate pyrophosphatase